MDEVTTIDGTKKQVVKHLVETEYSITTPCQQCGCPINLTTTEPVGQRVGVPRPCGCGVMYTMRWDFTGASIEPDWGA